MRNRDSATCAAQPACGCGAAQTASVFRAVDSCAPCSNNGSDWNHWDRNMRRSGCCECRSGGDGCNAWGASVNECCNSGCTAVGDSSWGNSCDACGTAAAINCNTCAAAANTGCAACTRCGNSPCTCHSNTCAATANTGCTACARCGNSPCTCHGNGCAAAANTGCAACTRCGNSPCTCHSNTCAAAANTGCAACTRCGNSPCTCYSNTCAAAANTGCTACTRCGNSPCTCGLTPAMVYETPHGLNALHGFEEAIRKGTLFGELYMPMNGECADNGGARLCDGQAEAFAAWELRLYLNTHPWDRHALELFRQCCRRGDLPNYACAFAFDDGCADRWRWTDAPWPWELGSTCENNCGCH